MQNFEQELNMVSELVSDYTGLFVKEIIPFTTENFVRMKDSDLILDIMLSSFEDVPYDFELMVVNDVYFNKGQNYFAFDAGRVMLGEFVSSKKITYSFHEKAMSAVLNIQNANENNDMKFILKIHDASSKDLMPLKTKDEFVLECLSQFNI